MTLDEPSADREGPADPPPRADALRALLESVEHDRDELRARLHQSEDGRGEAGERIATLEAELRAARQQIRRDQRRLEAESSPAPSDEDAAPSPDSLLSAPGNEAPEAAAMTAPTNSRGWRFESFTAPEPAPPAESTLAPNPVSDPHASGRCLPPIGPNAAAYPEDRDLGRWPVAGVLILLAAVIGGAILILG